MNATILENFISDGLQNMFLVGSEIKAGDNILARQFRKIGNNFARGHTCRKPTQNIVNRDAGFPHTRLAKALVGINP